MNCRSLILSALPAVLGVGLLAGCPDRTISQVVPSQGGALEKHIPLSSDIDILFVIDNSASTQDKQTIFAQNFPNFVTALDKFPTGRPNLHIGVINTTTDIGVDGFSPGCPHPDTADDGRLQTKANVAGCTPPTGPFISDIAAATGSGRIVNYTGTLGDELQCIGEVGTSGCGFESQLEAMKRALNGQNSQNAGFIRDGAFLAIIFLTDEDDASTTDSSVFGLADGTVGGRNDYRVQPLFAYKCDQTIASGAGSATYTNCTPRTDSYLADPASYATFLGTVKDPSQIVVAVIAGPPPGLSTNDSPPQTATDNAGSNFVSVGSLPLAGSTQDPALLQSCHATINGNTAIARPAVRLSSFLQAFGARGRFYSVCQGDYSPALADIGNTLFNAVSPCLEGNVVATDTDSTNPGLQLDCTVSDVQNANTATQVETQLPACTMNSDGTTVASNSADPCWFITTDHTACPAPDVGYELEFHRTTQPPTGTIEDVECAVAGADTSGSGSN